MNAERFLHELHGCAPTPIASYLKALGILRLVAEQADASARGAWRGNVFVLETTLSAEALRDFFLVDYAPSPIMAPWNGGSGFYPKDNSKALDALIGSESDRFGPLRRAAEQCVALLAGLGLGAKPDDDKELVLHACRNTLDDGAVAWLDAAFVLTSDGPKYPPLLGTGGNDGRLEFTNNFMQRLCELFDVGTGAPRNAAAPSLHLALWDTASGGLDAKSAVGQFLPGGAGGANSGEGFEGKSQLNPWDFVLLLEGAMLFGAAATRRLGATTSRSAFPFHVRHVGVGASSTSVAEEAATRGEMWLPTWVAPSTLMEVASMLTEGRIEHNGNAARDSVDAIRALAGLGVDRGLDRFVRYGFQVRNGLSYLAVPLGIHTTEERPELTKVAELDKGAWLARIRRKGRDKFAPGRVATAVRRLEQAIFELAEPSDEAAATYDALLAVSSVEQANANSLQWSHDSYLKPAPMLSAAWLPSRDLATWTPEQRLGASLASLGPGRAMRAAMEPIAFGKKGPFFLERWEPEHTWRSPRLDAAMADTLQRRLLGAPGGGDRGTPYDDRCTLPAWLDDVRRFLTGDIDDNALRDAVLAFALIEPEAFAVLRAFEPDNRQMPAAYALCKLCFASAPLDLLPIPRQPAIARALAAGLGPRATELAARRLRIAGARPIAAGALLSPADARRLSAALLFPLDRRSLEVLTKSLRQHDAA